jgi:hypothetical protein
LVLAAMRQTGFCNKIDDEVNNMTTTAQKLLEATRSLPEPLLAEVLDFAEFLRSKRAVVDGVATSEHLASLCGGLEKSNAFSADPLTIQRQLRYQ